MKKITLRRPKEPFNKHCSYEILIGQRTLTELKNGEEKTIEIPNELNNETLKAKIQWCGSEHMDLRNFYGDQKIVVSGNEFLNRKMPLLGAMFPLIGLMLYNLEVVPRSIGIAIFIIFIIAIIGTVTIWRNKWLNLKLD